MSRSARRAAKHPMVGRLAKVGFASRGVVYALLGLLALRIAFGDGGSADKDGAVHTVAAQPLGEVLLWVMAVGLAALAIWQLSEALFSGRDAKHRAASAARTVVYAFTVFSLVALLVAGQQTASTDSQSRDATKVVFELPAGQFLVGVAALGVIGLGGYWIHEGWTRKFMKEMRVPKAKARKVVTRIGVGGHLARGVIAVAAGVLLGRAAIQYDPDEAVGIDGALKSLAELPVGPVILAVVAVGLLLFAVYCFAEGRWHRV